MNLNKLNLAFHSKIAKLMCVLLAVFMIIAGFIIDKPATILKGIISYITSSDVLITDYFVIGSIGATLVNAGIVTLISVALAIVVKTTFTGSTIAMIFLMAGFAFFGKNPINILPFFLGVRIYCWYKKEPMRHYLNAALFSTALAPIVSEIYVRAPFHPLINIVLATLAGTIIGYLIIPLAEHSFATHKGYSLFNYGFAGGLIAMFAASVISSFGGSIHTEQIWYEGVPTSMLLFIIFIIFALIMSGLMITRKTPLDFIKIFSHSGRSPSDFVGTNGIGATMINMGLMGVLSLLYILLIGGDLSGPVIGAILTSIGFGAAGKHIKNSIPVIIGVYIASFFMTHDATVPSLQLAALFGTALAPISGQFGWVYGVVSGFLHSAVVLALGPICGGYNLYNNGFSSGFIALVMIALIQGFSKRSKSE